MARTRTTTSRVENSAQVSSYKLKNKVIIMIRLTLVKLNCLKSDLDVQQTRPLVFSKG
jgi:hypothetical protein